PNTAITNIPHAIADKLHLASGWTALSGVEDLLKEKQVDWSSFAQSTAYINVPAMLIVAAVTALLVLGIKESARVNNVIVVIKVSIVLLFIAVGISHVSTANWGGSLIPPNNGEFGEYRWSGILRVPVVVLF